MNVDYDTLKKDPIGTVKRIDSDTDMIRVPGGWIIRTEIWVSNKGCSVHTVFVPEIK